MTLSDRALDLSDVTVCTEHGRLIIDIPEMAVDAGEAVVLRGPSGAGKSTLLMVIAGLREPRTGAVRWGGADIWTLDDTARAAFRRRDVGLVFQEHLLFDELTAEQNAALAACYAPRRNRDAIRRGGFAGLERLGLRSAAGARSATMSGGERQRVAVARALANDPPIILADEPTASLDRSNADALTEELIDLARSGGRTLIAVSHDTALHERMDRTITIEDGRLTGDSQADA